MMSAKHRSIGGVFGLACLVLCGPSAMAQGPDTDLEGVKTAILAYLEGTSQGRPELLERAFHPDFSLYTVDDQGGLLVRSGAEYMAKVVPGQVTERIGRILSIDVDDNIAMARVEVLVPGWRTFIDHLLLVNYDGAWRIVQKSYTWRPHPSPGTVPSNDK